MKSKQRRSKKLSPEMMLLVLLAVPFVLVWWYSEGRYQKKESTPELESGVGK